MTSFHRPVPISAADITEVFDCGNAALNEWLQRFALVNEAAGMCRSYVITEADASRVVGFYSIAAGAVDQAKASARSRRGVAQHPIPVIVLTRLAIDLRFQGRGLGRALLRDALIRVNNAADEIGVRALLVHAKDQVAKDFYLAQAEFEESQVDPLQLMLLLKDLRKALGDE